MKTYMPPDYDPYCFDRGPDPIPLPIPRVRRARLLTPLWRAVLFAGAAGIVAGAAFFFIARLAGILVP